MTIVLRARTPYSSGNLARFVAAQATIVDRNSILLSAPEVKQAVAMRFAWHKTAEPDLVNGANLPAAAFRAGEIPDYLHLKIENAMIGARAERPS